MQRFKLYKHIQFTKPEPEVVRPIYSNFKVLKELPYKYKPTKIVAEVVLTLPDSTKTLKIFINREEVMSTSFGTAQACWRSLETGEILEDSIIIDNLYKAWRAKQW